MYTLHSFCQSGNAFKVAFLLSALKVEWKADDEKQLPASKCITRWK
jgi:hypothetical protein